MARRERGQALVNILTVLGIIAILFSIVSSDLKEMSDPLANASFTVEHFIRLTRARAISDTRVVIIRPTDNTHIAAFTAATCDDVAPTSISGLNIELPTGASLADIEWSVCFNQRGLADENVVFDLLDTHSARKTVSVALGGGTKIEDAD